MTTSLHPLHREIRDSIVKRAAEFRAHYLPNGDDSRGTTKGLYYVKTAVSRRDASELAHCHADLTFGEWTSVLDSLSRGGTSNEYWFIGALLGRLPQVRRRINPGRLARWLSRAEGWAEVDSLCQSVFSADDLLGDWDRWHTQLVLMSQNKNVHVRRASLVLLTKPVKDSEDARLAGLAFENVERLKAEKDILITKAVSWILRALTKNHRHRVIRYLKVNEASLPRIAVRETRIKLQTGKKSGRLA